MKNLRRLAAVLCITVLASFMNLSVYADGTTVKAYITISKYGEIVKDKNGEYVAESEITLQGKESYTLDDAFKEAHDLFYDGGAEAGYGTEIGDYGLSVTKVWGDTSGKFGYQMNLGTVSVWGPTQAVNDGDYIDLAVYENYYPDTESYAKFDAYTKETANGKTELTLFESYYGENWETLFKPCANAEILIDGEKTGIFTDENGKANLTVYLPGTHIVSAKKTKELVNVLTEEKVTVNALTAPACILNVDMSYDDAIIHSIVKKAIDGGLSESDQMYWLLGDIAGYSEIYPDAENALSETEKQKCVDKIIAKIEETESAGDLAKSIIALRSMGYDAENVYNGKGAKADAVAKLSAMIDAGSTSVTSIYTLPYVIIAMQEYLTDEKMATLVNAALAQKAAWQDASWGVDGVTPMMLALAPYSEGNDGVKNALSEAAELVKGWQGDSGAILCPDWVNGGQMASAASTGLAIAGFSAAGIDPETVIKNGNSMIDGLLLLKTGEPDGFAVSSFDTEQGLRGLIAWKLFEEGKRIYDFSEYPKNAAYATVKTGDVNNDGTVNAKDNAVLARYLASWAGYSKINMKAADTDNDGNVTAKDNAVLARHLANWAGYEALPYISNSGKGGDTPGGNNASSGGEAEKKD